jgi:protein required for attachment to host cells
MKTYLILVADRAAATVYRYQPSESTLEVVAELDNPVGRGHERDYGSSRPGRVSFPGGGLHAFEDHETRREHETRAYVHRMAAMLEHVRAAETGAHVIISAAPPLLGLLRQHLYLPRQPAVLEWPHNLANLPAPELERRLREVCLQH